MAGWFEALANFARAGGEGMTRYQQLNQLGRENDIQTQRLALQSRQQQANEDMQRMQQDRLQRVLMNQERAQNRDELLENAGPGYKPKSQEEYKRFADAGLGDLFTDKFEYGGLDKIAPNYGAYGPGSEGQKPENDVWGGQDLTGPMFIGGGYTPPTLESEPGVFTGTRDQRQADYKLMQPELQRERLRKAVLGFNPDDSTTYGAVAAEMPAGQFDIRDWRPDPGQTGPRLPNTDLAMMLQLPPDQLAKAISIKSQIDQVTSPNRPLDYVGPGQEFNMIRQLSGDWTKATAQRKELDRQLDIMQTGLSAAEQGDMNAGSQAVLVTFQKILDPDSVVRESEYDRSPQGLALKDKIRGYFNKLSVGGPGVPIEELREFHRVADEFIKKSNDGLSATRKRISKNAQRFNLPEDLIFTGDYGSDKGTLPQQVPTPQTPGTAPEHSWYNDGVTNYRVPASDVPAFLASKPGIKQGRDARLAPGGR